MNKFTRTAKIIGTVLVALLMLSVPLGRGSVSTVNAAGNTYYLSPNGNDSNPGSSSQPWRTVERAGRTVQPGDTVLVLGGIYRVSSVAFQPPGISTDRMVTYKAAPGARAIFTTANDEPPAVYVRSFVRVEGLWFGGRRGLDVSIKVGGGGSELNRGVQLIGNTFFGYKELSQGSAEYMLYQGNRFVLMGSGRFSHPIYLSGGSTAGLISQHAIVDNNMFIGGEGWAIHGWHNARSNIITRNFVAGQFWGIVQDGEDHLIANNFLWKFTGQVGTQGPIGMSFSGQRITFINNILGPDAIARDRLTGNTINKNAFLNVSPVGSGFIQLTPGQEQAQLGISAQQIDSTVAAIKQAFSQPINSIYSNGSIEGYFNTLRFTIPSGSPLYRTGQSWVPGVSSMNIGPNVPAPATLEEFWGAFCALGLRNWDRNGSLIQ